MEGLRYLGKEEPQTGCSGFISDDILRSLGIQLVDGRIAGVAAILGLEELFGEVVRLIQETFGYYHVGIYTLDPESGELYFRASTGSGAAPMRIDEGEGIVGWVAAHGEPLLANDVEQEPRYRYVTALPETLSELAVPLNVGDRVVGVLDVQSNERDAFDDEDLFVMQTLAAQVAIAVEDARIFSERQEQAWQSDHSRRDLEHHRTADAHAGWRGSLPVVSVGGASRPICLL